MNLESAGEQVTFSQARFLWDSPNRDWHSPTERVQCTKYRPTKGWTAGLEVVTRTK